MNENNKSKESISEVVKKYKEQNSENIEAKPSSIPQINPETPYDYPNGNDYQKYQEMMQKETDPDLMINYEIIKLPSKGLFYSNGLSEVSVEYMTSKDEDILTTPSLVESGKSLDVLLKRKIKTKGVVTEDLLAGDRNAILLFLRSSSYGNDYTVTVPDPRTGIQFETTVDLTKLEYKELTEMPDENGHFTVELPMRKKIVKIRLLSIGEEDMLFKKSEEIKDAYGLEYSEYNTMKLKSHIISINGNSDRSYIDKFVDAMPARDSLTIRKKVLDVQPDVDMKYTFTTKDGYKFQANLQIGLDFFFPLS